jgi:asparagine synthetase B (glutamine-hydrolysing)
MNDEWGIGLRRSSFIVLTLSANLSLTIKANIKNMCGIVSIFNIQEQTSELRQKALRMSQKIRHRGPDWSGIYCGGSAILDREAERHLRLRALRCRGRFPHCRDPIGVIPLYIGYDKDGKVYVASELKALEGQCDRYEPFLPGHYYWSKVRV